MSYTVNDSAEVVQTSQSNQPYRYSPLGYHDEEPLVDYSKIDQKVKTRLNIKYSLNLLGGLALAACAFLPWAVAPEYDLSLNGIKGDGIFSLGLGALIVLLAGLGLSLQSRKFSVSIMVIGFLSLALMLFETIHISSYAVSTISLGFGVIVGLVGTVVVLAGSLIAYGDD